ncbi:Maf/YceF/YhdE family protein [Marinobacterium lacunae]|uniref:7-methyl-GTP pyrophosphatase n=1 Tax=Marinobacterium lacunae TaxID=1232683 RepID=A0A081FTP6_9GAMM|nr:nucleoside triphosphate pyrophosphatase [Marinobacterium lacunae]KEA61901.1 Maf/YceF/YhdE family protein [Marinobacterium lacunae]
MAPTLVLASSSSYRRALLDKLGLDYICDRPDIDESSQENENADDLVKRLSLEKARAVATRHPNALIIGSDQVATLDDHILGKPLTHSRAIEQLSLTSGRTVKFLTGLCLLNANTGQYQLDTIEFDVVFRELTPKQIENYLIREKPYDCAGSFKSEGLGIALFRALQGDDPNSLIGLPLIRLVDMLQSEGLDVLAGD